MSRWREWIGQKKWKQMKKSDWVVLALFGVLLLVIAVPVGERRNATDSGEGQGTYLMDEEGVTEGGSAQENRTEQERYVAYLEKRLTDVLSRMEGVGEVEVMLTVADTGEHVVEKDVDRADTVTTESDSAGGSRTVSENSTKEQTIYVESGNKSYPYVQKELLPTVVGVVVVAEGGASPVVVSNISESVQALLPIEAHRIKVVKMCSKEE